MDTALYTGLGLCAVAGLRCAGMAAQWIGDRRRERREFLASLRAFEEQLDRAAPPMPRLPAAWQGYRRFVVQRIVSEANDISSVYLSPEDRRPLPTFLPGQFLTLRIRTPGLNQSAVRCYSLSDRPRADYYRITVKALSLEPEGSSSKGKVSRYLNRDLRRGNVLESQAPRGDFHLQDDARPAVLIAAGIGITPLLSMTQTILHQPGERQAILFYGVRNEADHAFAGALHDLAARHQRLHYVPCYSQPLASDRPAPEVLSNRRIDVDLVRRGLPDANFPFYVCGPGSFMESIVTGLREWGVAESDLHFEAFGPSTVTRSKATTAKASAAMAATSVTFQQAGVTAAWDGQGASLLEFAEAQGLCLPSGCRVGNCGMCSTRLLGGRVSYQQPPIAPVDPGFCLTCVARPDSSELTLDA